MTSSQSQQRTIFAVAGTLSLALGVFALGPAQTADAQDANELARQQVEAMKQMMEAQGMSAEEIQQMEAMYKQSMGPIVEAQAAHEAREQAEFEARYARLGRAVVTVQGRDFEMQITECEMSGNGDFRVRAQTNYDSRSDSLWLSGNSYYKRNELQAFLNGVGDFEVWIQPMIALQEGRFAWTGMAEGGGSSAEMTVTVDCRAGS